MPAFFNPTISNTIINVSVAFSTVLISNIVDSTSSQSV